MRIVFDLDFDSGSWPGPAPGAAAVGDVWLGPKGFLDRLEVSLGLQGRFPTEVERTLSLVSRVAQTRGFWSGSADADVVGTASRLLAWRDHLWECGWRGQGTGAPRLDALANLTEDLSGGFQDRLHAVFDALPGRQLDIDLVELGTPKQLLPRSWVDVLDRLSDCRVRVRVSAFPPVSSTGNLAAARSRGFAPTPNDPSLQLVRPTGPQAAAELVAAYLSSLDSDGSTVVVGGDAVLDEQLRRFALPTTGGDRGGNQNAYAHLLTCVCELAWAPTHPVRAHELLTHPDGPIPKVVARRLAWALLEWPSTTSDAFDAALESGLERVDESRRADLRERVRTFLTPATTGDDVTLEQLRPRLARLATWLRGRAQANDAETELLAAAHAVDALLRVIERSGLASITRTQLRQLQSLAVPSSSSSFRFPAEAGIRTVGQPGGLASPADRVVWWNFTEASYASPRALPLSASERAALKTLGVHVPRAGELAQRAAARYKRPLWRATKSLVLICPEVGIDGETAHPHPLWDEVVANLRDRSERSLLERRQPQFERQPSVVQRSPLAEVQPRHQWTLPSGLVSARERESSSSLESLLGCSLKWVLNYGARLGAGLAQPIRLDARIYGSAAHELLARLAQDGSLAGPDAKEKAAELFDREAPNLATSLFLPGGHNERSLLRRTVADGADHVSTYFLKHDFGLVEAEVERTRDAGSFVLLGKPDLLVRAPDGRLVVIDFKWGGESHRREAMKAGTAHQLAAYAFLVEPESEHPPATAFYILRSRRVLADMVGVLPHAEEIAFASSHEIWAGTVAGYDEAFAEASAGNVVAAGVECEGAPEPRKDSELVDGVLRLTAPCGFCDFSSLCGRSKQGDG